MLINYSQFAHITYTITDLSTDFPTRNLSLALHSLSAVNWLQLLNIYGAILCKCLVFKRILIAKQKINFLWVFHLSWYRKMFELMNKRVFCSTVLYFDRSFVRKISKKASSKVILKYAQFNRGVHMPFSICSLNQFVFI